LSDALERLIVDRALRVRLARRARETFEERFSVEAFTRALGEVYAEMETGRGHDGINPAEGSDDA
jgi:glycosyltransferase involved in cell wall biosynthesis